MTITGKLCFGFGLAKARLLLENSLEIQSRTPPSLPHQAQKELKQEPVCYITLALRVKGLGFRFFFYSVFFLSGVHGLGLGV